MPNETTQPLLQPRRLGDLEGYYGATEIGYTVYPFLTAEDLHAGTEGASLSVMSGVV